MKLYLTGDLEFISIMYGLSGASGMCITENNSKYFHIIFNYIPIL